MPTPDVAKGTTEAFPARRASRRRMRVFSLLMGAIVSVLAVLVYVGSALPALKRFQAINQRTIAEIECTETGCDTSKLTTDWQLAGSDYVIDIPLRYFLNVPTATAENPARFTPIDYSDREFVARFRQPMSFTSPNREVWRLYSRPVIIGGENFEIMVGYAEKADWKMIDTPPSLLGIVDAKLKDEADKIAAALASHREALRNTRADGFEVVDGRTGRVVEWGPWLPIFLPAEIPLPTTGTRFYMYEDDLYFVRTDTNGRLLTISLVSMGGLWWLAVLVGLAFAFTTLIAHALSRRFLRAFLAFMGVRFPTLEEALKEGENKRVEFKRGFSEDETRESSVEDELLKSIAAFANTNGGVIFIGIDDEGHIKGLKLDFKQRDRFEQKVRQLIRSRLTPMPPVEVGFIDARGLVIARVAVARGDDLAYMMGGVIYVRSGSSDVQARPEDLKRLVTENAF